MKDTRDIAKGLRQALKAKYQKYKVSVRSDVRSIDVVLLEAPFEAITNNESYIQVNHFYIKDEVKERIHPLAGEFFNFVEEILNKDHYDNSDAMIDYFDTNFYKHYQVGKWDKPFKMLAISQ